MRLRQILDDDSAVSPVIGVILMVAITVILAAVIASFVLGLGPSDAAPSAQFDFEETADNGTNAWVEITHQSGDKIDAETLYVRGDVESAYGNNGFSWVDNSSFSTGDEIASGDGVNVSSSDNDNDDWSMSVIWEKDDQSSELASQEA